MDYLRVRNWRRFQHYRDRTAPPWIKLYGNLLDNYDFCALSDETRGHLLLIWLLASRNGNRLPNDPAWIAKKIDAHSPIDISALVTHGWLERYDHSASTEKKRVEKKRKEKKKGGDKSPAKTATADSPQASLTLLQVEDGGKPVRVINTGPEWTALKDMLEPIARAAGRAS